MLENAKPGDALKARDVREISRLLARSTPGRTADGDGAPGHVTQLGTGVGTSTSDHGKTFFVEITGLGPVVDGRQSYTFTEVGVKYGTADPVETVQIEGGGVTADEQTPAFPVDPLQTFNVGDYAIARRSRRSIYAWELAPVGAGGAGGYWGFLIEKTYDSGCVVYRFARVIPSSGCSRGWEFLLDGDGHVVTDYAVEVNNVDLPVQPIDEFQSGSGTPDELHAPIVWVTEHPDTSGESGSGGSGGGVIRTFDHGPRWEIVEKTGDVDPGTGYADGVILRYLGGDWFEMEEIYIVDANGDTT